MQSTTEIPRPNLEDVSFENWRSWTEPYWRSVLSLVKKHEEPIRRRLQEGLLASVENSSPYYFTVAACRRDVEWIALASEEIPSIIREERELMERIKQNAYALGHIFKWCEGGCLENELYLPDETCVLDFSDLVDDPSDCVFNVEELELNRWVFLLILYPELAEKCTSYDKFSGFDACMLLAKQPRLACHFSIEAIGNFRGRLWVGYDSKDYNFAWDCLVRVTPEFAKFRMSVERNKNEES
jgi:hypothetical protein